MIGLLTILFLLALCGYSISLRIEHQAFRKEVKKMLRLKTDKRDLKVLSFTIKEAKNLEWEDEKEFRYQGKMYDIVSAEYKNGHLTYYCWKDDVEQELIEQINVMYSFLHGTDKKEQHKKEHFTKLGNSLICQKIQKFSICSVQDESERPVYSSRYWPSLLPSIPTPPPELG